MLVIAPALAIYLLALRTFQVGAWTDDGFYVILARALAQGQGMRLIHLPGAPETAIVPPAYPLALSALAARRGGMDQAVVQRERGSQRTVPGHQSHPDATEPARRRAGEHSWPVANGESGSVAAGVLG